MAIPVVEFPIRGYKIQYAFLPNCEVFQNIFFYYILKWNDGEPTKFGPIFFKHELYEKYQ